MNMTVTDVINDTDYSNLTIYEGMSRANMTAIAEQLVDFDITEAIDYWTEECSDGSVDLNILVRPEKVLKYIHVGAPAPQYAINSISSISSAISYAASQVGCYRAMFHNKHSIPVDIMLAPDVTDVEIEEMFKVAKEYMEDNEYTGVDASKWSLTYDAGTASIRETEPTRNW